MPERTCLITKQKHDKSKLLRFVWFEGKVQFDKDCTYPGRGAYILPRTDVIEKAMQLKIWLRAFKIKGEELDFAALEKELNKAKFHIMD